MAIKRVYIAIANASNALAVIAPTKFNKLGSVHFTFDDGSPGNFIAQSIFDDRFYTDGCGNNIPYALAVAINGGTGDVGDVGYNPAYLQKPQIDEILANRGDIENHGFYHGGDNSIDDLNQLHNQILLRTGYKMGFTVAPGASTGFAHASYLANYVGMTSQSGGATFDEFNSEGIHKLWPTLANPYRFSAIVRDFDDEWQLRSVIDFLKNEIGLIITGQRQFEMVGTHTTFDTPDRLDGFTEVIDYIYTVIADRVLVCCMREILDYRRMQVMPVTQSFAGGLLTIEVDVVDENDTLRFEDLCFNITTDGTITGVTTSGFTNSSFNPITGLVNVSKERVDWTDIPPEPGLLTMIKGRQFIVIEETPPSDNFDPNLSVLENTATGAWYAATTEKFTTNNVAIHGDHVGKFNDKIGNFDLDYYGFGIDNVPPMPFLNGPPLLDTISLDVPYVKMWNLPNLNYESNDFGANTGVPYVIGFVAEIQPYGDYEALLPGSSGYIGLVGYGIRAGSPSYGVPGTEFTMFKRTFVQVEFKEFEINVYFDGVFKGTRANDLSETNSQLRRKNGLFVFTNNACWNFFAMWDWRGEDYNTLMANKANIDAAIVSKFNCGVLNPKPRVNTLFANFNTTTRIWSANITPVNATSEQIQNATYMWVLKGESDPGSGQAGSFINQKILSNITNTLHESEYLSYTAGDRLQLTPYVSIGGWDYIKGETKSL